MWEGSLARSTTARTAAEPTIQRNAHVDKKSKKRLEVIRKKVDNLRKQVAGAKQQTDEPDEVERLEQEIAALSAERDKLKNS
jgi:hypothetical protein